MKLYDWESWQKKRDPTAVDSNTIGLGSHGTMVRQMKTKRSRHRRGVVRISRSKLSHLGGDRLAVGEDPQSSDSELVESVITGADEEPSVVMNEADMLSSPKRPPTLRRGRTDLKRKKTVTINDETFMGPDSKTMVDP